MQKQAPSLPAALALAASLLALAAPPSGAQGGATGHESTPRVAAVRLSAPLELDGRLDEEAWSRAPAAGSFRQQDPREGEPATQRTEVRFALDDDALYVGARMYDSLGAAGVRTRLARRDQQIEGDYLQLVFDTFHDHTGRTIFWINPSAVKYDAGQAAPSVDPSWDPVWEAATRVDSLGWTAELRIPLSQLRFPLDSGQTWGLQIWRYVERLNETSMWSFWGKDDAGGPRRFGHLQEMRIGRRPRGFELLPYAVSRASYVQPSQPGSPFQQESDYTVRVGGDVKALLTSTLTLDATINPDFGQVEVDPAVVNLSAFETFFEERRPFFVEGSGLFGFGGFSCYFCSNVSSMSLFYSRRIGRRPQGTPTALGFSNRFEQIPENSPILGAAKVTGRTAGGYQIGLLDAVTGAEEAQIVAEDGRRLTRQAEPLSNYFVGRVKRNFSEGRLTLGAIGTSAARSFDYDSLRILLPRHAEAVGFDWNLNWKNQTYSFFGNVALSQASGDSAAVERLQRSSARYFQRPDREHGSNGLFSDRYEPGAESLRGYGGYARLAKDAGSFLWETAVNYRSPGFEVNDLAFLTRADYVWMNANVFRLWNRPTSWYRRLEFITGSQQQYNYDGDLTERDFHVFGGIQTPGYWYLNTFLIYRPETFDDRLTRGGPTVRRDAEWLAFLNLNTDSRRPVVVSTSPVYGRTADGHVGFSVPLDVRVKPASNVSLSVGPSFSRDATGVQYVDSFDDPTATHFYGRRVVFADLEQYTFSMNTRLNWTFTPALTLELFAQPFVSSGEYTGFKEFDAPRTTRRTRFDAQQIRLEDDEYVLDPDRDPATENFRFGRPDFNFRSLRGNAVLRWEYRPGSTLFFVWQQNRSGTESFGDFEFGRDTGGIFDPQPDNIFLVKATYWLGR